MKLILKNYKQISRILKSRLKKLKNHAGRNNKGNITVRHQGGGHKKRYREITFNRIKPAVSVVTNIEYDPYRNAYIASVFNIIEKNFFYILAPKSLFIGDIVRSGLNTKFNVGNFLCLKNIPLGTCIHNIYDFNKKVVQYSRSAGAFSLVKKKEIKSSTIKLSSGKKKYFCNNCYATIGIVSNDSIFLKKIGKAGRSRWLNKRPSTRGVAMNPIDHYNGGGEGKKSGKSSWGS